MEIDFEEISDIVPTFVFQEYGQLTGNYVHAEKIHCVWEDGRVQIWLDEEGYRERDTERLICDYDERMFFAGGWRPPDEPDETSPRDTVDGPDPGNGEPT